ncbi:hypothetical protein [Streptomyces sp. NPDC006925]|uniref:hypothetical protein n=1 Tax=Streptomyces sp. NPDC006925 TaxID=3364768 RepID=UPI003677B791
MVHNSRERQRVENREQLARACAGLLPEKKLERFLPGDSAGELEVYGTLLKPRRESRALLDCTLTWGDSPEKWYPNAQVHVRAEGVPFWLNEADAGEDAPDFGVPLPSGTKGTTTQDADNGGQVVATLTVPCPQGAAIRGRTAHKTYVSVSLPFRTDSSEPPYMADPSDADRRLVSRTAVRVADWVSGRRGCGGPDLGDGSR